MPVSSSLISAIPAGLQVLGGGLQAIFGSGREKKAENALENLKTPSYTASKPISDYYQSALSRYNTNPYQSQMYLNAMNGANRSLGAGIGALQDRRSAIAGIGRLAAQNNNAALQAGTQAENLKSSELGQLGQAVGQKAADDRYGFQINSLMPYEKQLNLLSMKAGAGANTLNSGLQNVFGGLSGLSQIFGGQNKQNNQQQSVTANQFGYQ